MPKAVWNGAVLAHSDATRIVDGCHYFPPQSIDCRFFFANNNHTICPAKGTACYFDIVVNHTVNPNAAWVFHTPKAAAAPIAGYIAFADTIHIG